MQDFRRLRVWQTTRAFTLSIYRATGAFPREERYGLAAQMRSCAISIGSNIAEGSGRGSNPDSLRFLQMAFSSTSELLHQLIISSDLEYLPPDQFTDLEERLGHIRGMIGKLMSKLR